MLRPELPLPWQAAWNWLLAADPVAVKRLSLLLSVVCF